MRQQIKCSKKQIADYWTQSGRLGSDFEGESELSSNRCFACRYQTKSLERAHILADCLGGPPTTDNLHLLCWECHRQSEMLAGEVYWRWILARRSAPQVDPVKEYIKKMKNDFRIDVFDEMQKAIQQASTVSDMNSRMRRAILMADTAEAPDMPITEQDKAKAIEVLQSMRDFFENGDMS